MILPKQTGYDGIITTPQGHVTFSLLVPRRKAQIVIKEGLDDLPIFTARCVRLYKGSRIGRYTADFRPNEGGCKCKPCRIAHLMNYNVHQVFGQMDTLAESMDLGHI